MKEARTKAMELNIEMLHAACTSGTVLRMAHILKRLMQRGIPKRVNT